MDNVPATPASIGELRGEFATWVAGTVRTTEGRLSDITLVVYEALAKTTNRARRGNGSPGEVSVNARYTHKTRSLHVTVNDQESRPHDPWPGDDGIDLIHALCDQPVITSTNSGTEIDLSWTLFA